MDRATHERIIERLRGDMPVHPPFAVPASRYRDPAWLAREAAAFTAPQIVGAASALVPGACMPVDLPGQAAIVTRDASGQLHAFANACRHRATRLVDAPCAAKALVCPYHGWTYDLAGALVHVPHADAFAGLERGRDLHALPVAERHGLVWLGGDPATHLGELDADVASLALADRVLWRSARTQVRCNWKLLVEAFLDGYHIRILHRDSVYRFFIDAASIAEQVGPHVRAVTARRALREAPRQLAGADLHELGTPSYLVFPATVIIEHPDFVSVMIIRPEAVDLTLFEHLMFVPRARRGETEHWSKSWTLIEDTVFQREDLVACAQIQRGLPATDELLFGSLEYAVRYFHDALAARV